MRLLLYCCCDILGEPLTDKEAKGIIGELDPKRSNKISFDTFLSWWHAQHKGGKKNKSYARKFKFICAGLKKTNFDVDKIIVKPVGIRATTDFRFTFHYEQSNGKLKQISPWHDIPLHHFKDQNIFNFICEIPKWSRAKYEISTGIHSPSTKHNLHESITKSVAFIHIFPFECKDNTIFSAKNLSIF